MKMKKIVLALSPALLKDKAMVQYAMTLALVWMKQRKLVYTEPVFTYPVDAEFTVVVDESRVVVTGKAAKTYVWWHNGQEPVLLDKNFMVKPAPSSLYTYPLSAYDEYRAYTEEDAQSITTPPPEYPDRYTQKVSQETRDRAILAMYRAGHKAGYWAAILYMHRYSFIDSTTGWAVADREAEYTRASINRYSPMLMERTNREWAPNITKVYDYNPANYDPWGRSTIYETGAAFILALREDGNVYNSQTLYNALRPMDLCVERYSSRANDLVSHDTLESWSTSDPPACTWQSPLCHTHSELRYEYTAFTRVLRMSKMAPYYDWTYEESEYRTAYDYDYLLQYSTGPGTGGLTVSPTAWTENAYVEKLTWEGLDKITRVWSGGYSFYEGYYNYSAGTVGRNAPGGIYYNIQLDRGPTYSRLSFAVGKHLRATSTTVTNDGAGDNVDLTNGVIFGENFTDYYENARTTWEGYVRGEYTSPIEMERLWDRYEGFYHPAPYDHGWGSYAQSKQELARYDWANSTVEITCYNMGIGFIWMQGEEAQWHSFWLNWNTNWQWPGFQSTAPEEPYSQIPLYKGFKAMGFGDGNDPNLWNIGAGFLTEFTPDLYERSAAEEQWARDLRYEFDKTGEFLVNKDPDQTEWNSTTGDWEFPAGYEEPEYVPDPDEE